MDVSCVGWGLQGRTRERSDQLPGLEGLKETGREWEKEIDAWHWP